MIHRAAIGHCGSDQRHLQWCDRDGTLADGDVGGIAITPALVDLCHGWKLLIRFLARQQAGALAQKELSSYIDNWLDAAAFLQRVMDEIGVAGFFKRPFKIVMTGCGGVLYSSSPYSVVAG